MKHIFSEPINVFLTRSDSTETVIKNVAALSVENGTLVILHDLEANDFIIMAPGSWTSVVPEKK